MKVHLFRFILASLSLISLGSLQGCCSSCAPESAPAARARQRALQASTILASKVRAFGVQNLAPSSPTVNYSDGMSTTAGRLMKERLDPSTRIKMGKPLGFQISTNTMSGNGAFFPLASGDGPPTIAGTLLGLDEVIDRLDRLVKTTSGEIQRIGQELLAEARNTEAELNQDFKDRLNQLTDALNELEKRTIADANALVERMQISAEALEAHALDAAKIALYEANVTAYDTLASLPCRDQVPRFVYAQPFKMRVGLDIPEVHVRGNFLNFDLSLEVKVKGAVATVISRNANELVVRIPDSVLASIQETQSVSVAASPSSCHPHLFGHDLIKPTSPLTIAIQLSPPVTYRVHALIKPIVSLPVTHVWPFDFYDIDNDCNADRACDQTWDIPADWNLDFANVRFSITTANCGSSAGPPRLAGPHAIYLPAHITGCGTNWIWNCKGRGWIGYHLDVPSKQYQGQPWSESNQDQVGTADQRTYTFDYRAEQPIPADNQGVRWTYNLSLQIQVGSQQPHRVELSDVNPNGDGVESRIDSQSGKLAVTITAPNVNFLEIN